MGVEPPAGGGGLDRPRFLFDPFPYQWDGITDIVSRPSSLMVWGIGTGKGHLVYAATTFLIGEGLVDRAFIICESNKTVEWPDDFRENTTLPVTEYDGAPAKRRTLVGPTGQVLVSTYETVRNDAASFSGRKVIDGPLVEELEGSNLLVVLDEVNKLGNRGSKTYRAHERLFARLRKKGNLWVVGLTGTPVETSIESVFNYCRLIAPDAMPTVDDFDRLYVKWRNEFDVAKGFHHIDDSDRLWPDEPTFMERLAPILSVKSNRDPDVIEQFPEQVDPEAIYLTLPKKHREFYDALDDLSDEDEGAASRRWFNILRQVAIWPEALTFSEGTGDEPTLAQRIVAEVGTDFLRGLGSVKADRVLADAQRVIEQGEQIICFSFFAQSVLRLFAKKFDEAGIEVGFYHGQLSKPRKREVLGDFRAGKQRVLLAGDSAAKGVNLPEAIYVGNIEPPTKHSTWDQRRGRNYRVDSTAARVFTFDWVALDTIEEPVVKLNLLRHRWGDQMHGDAAKLLDYLTAAERRRIIREARERAERQAA